MRLLVTGASGFLGRYVVAEALRRGHDVRAMVRPATSVSGIAWPSQSRLSIVRADLRAKGGLADLLKGVETVLHLAAQKQGDLHAQLASTVVGTENLLAAMNEADVSRLIAVSTLSVYDFLGMPSYGTLDESSRIEVDPSRRETYAQAKLAQEQLISRHAREHGLALTIVRPGVVWGRDNLFTDQLGIRLGSRWCLRFAVRTRLPLTYVENCAAAIVRCAECEAAVGRVFNIVDDQTPTRRHYAKELCRRMPGIRMVPISGVAVRAVARLAQLSNQLLFGGRAYLPWPLVPAKLNVQIKPLRFTNERIHRITGWTPQYSLDEGLDRAFHPSRDSAAAHPVEAEAELEVVV